MNRLVPSSYRPLCASLVQVAWQAYLSSVSFDVDMPCVTHSETADALTLGGASHAARSGQGTRDTPTPSSDASMVSLLASLASDRGKASSTHKLQRHATSRYAYRPRDTYPMRARGSHEGPGGGDEKTLPVIWCGTTPPRQSLVPIEGEASPACAAVLAAVGWQLGASRGPRFGVIDTARTLQGGGPGNLDGGVACEWSW